MQRNYPKNTYNAHRRKRIQLDIGLCHASERRLAYMLYQNLLVASEVTDSEDPQCIKAPNIRSSLLVHYSRTLFASRAQVKQILKLPSDQS